MKLFLKAKHWMLFLAIIAAATIGNSTPIPDKPEIGFSVAMLAFMVIILGWFYSIAMAANAKVAPEFQKGTFLLRAGLVIAAIYTVIMNTVVIPSIFSEPGGFLPPWLVPIHLLSMAGIFYAMWFAARQLSVVRLGQQVKFLDFAGTFFLMWFFFIGVWWIQPEVNRFLGEDT